MVRLQGGVLSRPGLARGLHGGEDHQTNDYVRRNNRLSSVRPVTRLTEGKMEMILQECLQTHYREAWAKVASLQPPPKLGQPETQT